MITGFTVLHWTTVGLLFILGFSSPSPLPATGPVGEDVIWDSWSEDEPFLEGDIIIDSEIIPITEFRPGQRNLVSDPRLLWPDKMLYYEFSPGQFSPQLRARVEDALRDITTHSCVRFQPRTQQKTYLKLRETGKGCATMVGYHEAGAALDLHVGGHKCHTRGTVQHEFLHALGFWHEHTRPDRDKYVTVIWDNVRPGRKSNFRRRNVNESLDLGLPYDYASVMHYRQAAFSKTQGLPTLVPNNKEAIRIMGQRQRVSRVDIAKLNRLYNCTGEYYRGDELEGKEVIIGDIEELEEGEPRISRSMKGLQIEEIEGSLNGLPRTRRESVNKRMPSLNNKMDKQENEAFAPQNILPELLKGVLDNDKERPIVIQFAIYQPIVYKSSGQNESMGKRKENESEASLNSYENENNERQENNHKVIAQKLKPEQHGKTNNTNNSFFLKSEDKYKQSDNHEYSTPEIYDSHDDEFDVREEETGSSTHPRRDEIGISIETTNIHPTSNKQLSNQKVNMPSSTISYIEVEDQTDTSRISISEPQNLNLNLKEQTSKEDYILLQSHNSKTVHHNFDEFIPSSQTTHPITQHSDIPVDTPVQQEEKLHSDSKTGDSIALKYDEYTTETYFSEAAVDHDEEYDYTLLEPESSPIGSAETKYDESVGPEKHEMAPNDSKTNNRSSSGVKHHPSNSESADMKIKEYFTNPDVISKSPEYSNEYVPDIIQSRESSGENINLESWNQETDYKKSSPDRTRSFVEKDDKDISSLSDSEKSEKTYKTKYIEERKQANIAQPKSKHDLFIEEDFNDQLDMEIRKRRLEQAKLKVKDKGSRIVGHQRENEPKINDRNAQSSKRVTPMERYVPDQGREVEMEKDLDNEEDLISKSQYPTLNLNPRQALPLNAPLKVGVRRLIRKQTPNIPEL